MLLKHNTRVDLINTIFNVLYNYILHSNIGDVKNIYLEVGMSEMSPVRFSSQERFVETIDPVFDRLLDVARNRPPDFYDNLSGEELLARLEKEGLVSFEKRKVRESTDNSYYLHGIRYSLLNNLDDETFKEKFLEGIKSGLRYQFRIRPDDYLPDSDFTEELSADNVVLFTYSIDLVHMNFARLNEFRDGMNQKDYRDELVRRQFEDGLPEPIKADKDDVELRGILLDRDSSGSDIVGALEDGGRISFHGRHRAKMREVLIEGLDGSSFFKRAFSDAFLSNHRKNVWYDTGDLRDNGYGYAGGSDLSYNILDQDLIDTEDIFDATLIHETFHSVVGLKDSADMEQAMAVYYDEMGLDPAGIPYIADEAGDSFDYDLFQATRADFESAGALIQEDYYDYGTPEAKAALEKILGPGYDGTVLDAFHASCQSYGDNAFMIAIAYVNALDGGEVEKIRAKQLEALGIDPESLKNWG